MSKYVLILSLKRYPPTLSDLLYLLLTYSLSLLFFVLIYCSVYALLVVLCGGELLNDRRNPALARTDGEEFTAYAGRLDEYISRLVWQSEGHRMWYTHKNPYGCWICDIIFIIEQLRTLIVPKDDGPTGEPK